MNKNTVTKVVIINLACSDEWHEGIVVAILIKETMLLDKGTLTICQICQKQNKDVHHSNNAADEFKEIYLLFSYNVLKLIIHKPKRYTYKKNIYILTNSRGAMNK